MDDAARSTDCPKCGAGTNTPCFDNGRTLATSHTARRDAANPCPRYAARLLPPLRAVARDLGYAVGVHGSLARDIDLIAVPWTTEAVDPPALAEAIRLAALAEIGIAYMAGSEVDDPHHAAGCPGTKPHGRRVWRFHLGGGPYIDLSVMPPMAGCPRGHWYGMRSDALPDQDGDLRCPLCAEPLGLPAQPGGGEGGR